MAFWSEQSLSEPMRSNRWFVLFGGSSQNLDQMSYALKKVDKPSNKTGIATHKYLNHEFHFPGRVTWEPVNMTFAAVTDPASSAVLMNILKNSGYYVPTKKPEAGIEAQTVSKAAAGLALGQMTINQVNPEGTVIEAWTLRNPWFESVKFGTLDYESENIVEIACTVRYDWAEMVPVR